MAIRKKFVFDVYVADGHSGRGGYNRDTRESIFSTSKAAAIKELMARGDFKDFEVVRKFDQGALDADLFIKVKSTRKRKPQPKKKNAFSAFKKDYVNFKGSEISDVSFQDIGKSVTIMVTLKDGTKIFSWENADIALRQKNRSTGTGDRVSGDSLVRFLIGNYVK